MDVTKNNFQSVLKKLDEELSNASFLSLDTEFTGLHDGSLECKIQPLDTPSERYRKIRETSSKFMIIQVGLTLFFHNKMGNKWSYKSYNFYVFPNFGQFQNIRGFPEHSFLCQAASISFLSNNDFDFNKLFKNGICYLNLSDEEKVKKLIEDKLSASDSTNPSTISAADKMVIIPEEQQCWMNNAMSKIEGFLKSDDIEQKELVLENSSPFQRKLLYYHGKEKFPSAFFDSRNNEHGNRIMVISKTPPESKKDMIWDEFEQAVGFSKVLRKISESGKLVVVHNSFLDVVHIIRQFFTDLPVDYKEFKALAKIVFPRILDTKVMASSKTFRDLLPNSALEPLLQLLSKKPFEFGEISPIPDVPHYTVSQGKVHEAGYDSFITGLCFLSMSKYLETLGGNSEGADIPESGYVNAFTQKIFMMMSPDIPYLCLDGPDMNPPRDHIFYMTFPKTWKLHDIQQLFSIYGPVYVNWAGDTAAFVTVIRKENKHLILKNIHPPNGFVLRSYQSYMESNSPQPSIGNGERKQPKKRSITAASAQSGDTTTVSKKVRRSQDGNAESTVDTPQSPQFEVPSDWD